MSQLEALIVKPLNHLLRASPWAVERLQRHAGAHVCLRAGPLAMTLCIDGRGLLQAAQMSGDADVTIELKEDFPAKLLLERDSLMSSARLSGSADVAETLAFVFRNLRWDCEGDLAAVVGDIPARRLSLAGASLLRGMRAAAERVSANLVEFATEESRFVVSPGAAADFFRDVDCLRDEVARLEKRIARLAS